MNMFLEPTKALGRFQSFCVLLFNNPHKLIVTTQSSLPRQLSRRFLILDIILTSCGPPSRPRCLQVVPLASVYAPFTHEWSCGTAHNLQIRSIHSCQTVFYFFSTRRFVPHPASLSLVPRVSRHGALSGGEIVNRQASDFRTRKEYGEAMSPRCQLGLSPIV